MVHALAQAQSLPERRSWIGAGAGIYGSYGAESLHVEGVPLPGLFPGFGLGAALHADYQHMLGNGIFFYFLSLSGGLPTVWQGADELNLYQGAKMKYLTGRAGLGISTPIAAAGWRNRAALQLVAGPVAGYLHLQFGQPFWNFYRDSNLSRIIDVTPSAAALCPGAFTELAYLHMLNTVTGLKTSAGYTVLITRSSLYPDKALHLFSFSLGAFYVLSVDKNFKYRYR
jgi:hypothetical protein